METTLNTTQQKQKRIPYVRCDVCEIGIRSSSLYYGKCQRCRITDKRLKNIKEGKEIQINKHAIKIKLK